MCLLARPLNAQSSRKEQLDRNLKDGELPLSATTRVGHFQQNCWKITLTRRAQLDTHWSICSCAASVVWCDPLPRVPVKISWTPHTVRYSVVYTRDLSPLGEQSHFFVDNGSRNSQRTTTHTADSMPSSNFVRSCILCQTLNFL